MRLALEGCLEMLSKNLHPPHEVPSERVCMGDLLRLGRERSIKREALQVAVDELVERASLIGKRSMAEKINHVSSLVGEAGALDWRLHWSLSSYKNDLTHVLQLPGEWFTLARDGYVRLGQEMEELVGRALRS